MSGRRAAMLLSCLAVAALTPVKGAAQIRASERGSVSQTVDGTVITMDYARPQVRGRDTLYGGVVPFGKIWTGANWATTIEASRDITLDGHPLPAGKYSVWMQVKQGAWTAIIDRNTHRYHMMPPPDSTSVLRFDVRPKPAPFTEALTWSFPEVRPTGTTLQMAWGDTAVTFDIGVQPSRKITVEPELAQRYVGSYRLTQMPPFQAGEVSFEITYENEKLVGHWEKSPNPLLATVWLVPLGEGMFMPIETEDGELVDMQTEIIFEFRPVEGRAQSFELRILGDMLAGKAERIGG